eukprot:7286013-Pyramimonas_sp.AAC.1
MDEKCGTTELPPNRCKKPCFVLQHGAFHCARVQRTSGAWKNAVSNRSCNCAPPASQCMTAASPHAWCVHD